MNLYMKYQIASTGGQFGYIGSPKKANFLCVISLYFSLLVLGHPVLLPDLINRIKDIRF